MSDLKPIDIGVLAAMAAGCVLSKFYKAGGKYRFGDGGCHVKRPDGSFREVSYSSVQRLRDAKLIETPDRETSGSYHLDFKLTEAGRAAAATCAYSVAKFMAGTTPKSAEAKATATIRKHLLMVAAGTMRFATMGGPYKVVPLNTFSYSRDFESVSLGTMNVLKPYLERFDAAADRVESWRLSAAGADWLVQNPARRQRRTADAVATQETTP